MSDLSLRWAAVVEQAVTSAEFRAAWREVGEAGVGSMDAVEACFALVQQSAYHGEHLTNTAKDIAEAAATWADAPMDESSFERFMVRLLSLLQTTAAIYLAIGALTGIGSISGVGAGDDDDEGVA